MRKKKQSRFWLTNAFNVYNLRVLRHFHTENCTWRFDIAFLVWFLRNSVQKIYIKKNIQKQLSTLDILSRLDMFQNVVIPSGPKISHGGKMFNTLILYTTVLWYWNKKNKFYCHKNSTFLRMCRYWESISV